jgi:hypothetical protein
MKQIKVQFVFQEPVLGSTNNNPLIMAEFQAERARNANKAAEEVAALPVNVARAAAGKPIITGAPADGKQDDGSAGGGTVDEVQEEIDADEVIEKQTTVFPRNPDGTLFCWDYQWRGFLKEAFTIGTELTDDKQAKEAMGPLSKWKVKAAVDSLLFVVERRIPFFGPDKQPIREVAILERPLRATTQRGERICLARSEIIPAGSTVQFTLKWLEAPAKGKKPSKMGITVDTIAWAMGYALLKGFGQWRGGGYGRCIGTFLGPVEETNLTIPAIPAA